MKIAISFILLAIMLSSCQKAPAYKEYAWKPFSQQAIKDAVAQDKPVVIDFSAQWCPNCHDLDRMVFSRPDIQAKLSQVTALKMDVTNQDDPKVQQILDQYNIEGVPTVIFLNSRGKEIDNARVIGFVTPSEFSASMALLKIFNKGL